MELDEQNPLSWIHEEDLPAAHQLVEGLASESKTTGSLRFRGHDGQWRSLDVTLNLVLLDQHMTAEMAHARRPRPHSHALRG